MRLLFAALLIIGSASSGCSSGPASRPAPEPRVTAVSVPGPDVAQQARGRGNRELPPGIAKNIERGKPLPPGIARRRVPYAQLQTLPSVRDGFEYVVVAGKVMLIETATRVVHDVLADVMYD